MLRLSSKEMVLEFLQKILKKGFFGYGITLLFVQILAFTTRILLAKYLPVQDFGRYIVLIEFSIFFSSFLTLGIPESFFRYGVIEDQYDAYFARSLIVFFFWSLFLYSFYFILRYFFIFFEDKIVENLLNWVLLASFSLASFNYFSHLFAIKKEVKKRCALISKLRVFHFFGVLLGTILQGFYGAIVGFLLAHLVFFSSLIFFQKDLIKRSFSSFFVSKGKWKAPLVLSIWNSGYTLMLTIGVYFFYQWIELNYSVYWVSQWGLAMSLIIIAKMLFAVTNEILFPYFFSKKSTKDFWRLWQKSFLLNLACSFVILICTFFIFPHFIMFFLGNKFSLSIPILQIIAFGEIFMGFSIINEKLLHYFSAGKSLLTSAVVYLSPLVLLYFRAENSIHDLSWIYCYMAAGRLIASTLLLMFRVKFKNKPLCV